MMDDPPKTEVDSDPLPPATADPALAELTAKHAAFVLNYIDTGNASESARRAGYSASSAQVLASTGSRLLAEAPIRKAIAAMRERIWTEQAATRAERVAVLSAIVRGVGEPPPSAAERIAAAKLLAGMHGELAAKTQVNLHAPSYVVPLPNQIKDAEVWAAEARRVMGALEGPAKPPATAG